MSGAVEWSTPHAAAAPAPSSAPRPMVGILGVLLGALISTLYGRITTFGLADVRGAVHAGFDEGAWITTAQTAASMMIGPLAIWLAAAFGIRRVLLMSVGSFLIAATLLPLSPNLPTLLGFQIVAGLSTGTFVPLTLGFVVRNLPARLVAYGIAVYGLNSELSQNIGASMEGWFTDHWSWRWIFWINAVLALPMLACVRFGMPKDPINRSILQGADPWGMLYASLAFPLIYAAIDQGNRLDWLNSGLICGLLIAGMLLLMCFIVHVSVVPRPWINLRFVVSGNFPMLMLMLIAFRFVVLSTAYIIPQYMGTVRGLRALDTGDVLLVIALPQFVLAPIVGTLLLFIDARAMMAVGFALVGAACLMGADITSAWVSADFLPSQIVQAVGQSIGLTSLVFFAVRHLRPADALTFGVMLQTARLLGGELGSGLMQTYVRVREQVQSYLLGLHVQSGSGLTTERLRDLSATLGDAGSAASTARATGLLVSSVRVQAETLSFVDAFHLVALVSIGCVLAMLLLRRAPDPTEA